MIDANKQLSITKRDLIVAGSTTALVLLVVGATLAVVHVTDDGSRSTASTTVTMTQSVTGPVAGVQPTPQQTSSAQGLGTPMTDGSVKLIVNSVSAPASVPLVSNSTRQTSQYVEFVDTPPKAGAKFIRVETTIENVGKRSMDLTCSFPIQALVLDDQQREFKPIEDIYKIKGNPECNADLAPGFTSPMTFFFQVPTNATIKQFGFDDPELHYNKPQLTDIAKYTN